MKLNTIPYNRYERGLPQKGNWILGHEIEDSIIVYQAFNHDIADYAIQYQKFGGDNYSFSRMTWIKPNFLWMMYRSGWASKQNQERILAIRISKKGFIDLLSKGVYSSYQKEKYETKEVWKTELRNSDVRIQWDPDHNAKGGNLERRAVQIGIKGNDLKKFNSEYVQEIIDITEFVKHQKINLNHDTETCFVMHECIIDLPYTLKKKYGIAETFTSCEIEKLIESFETKGVISDTDFERLLLEGDLREDFINYIKNYHYVEFSRYLLTKSIEYRKLEKEIMCEDLLVFSYFASKNKSTEDLDLIMEAKYVDFDTWCGFDGEMIFYPLGYEKTLQYLQKNEKKFGEKPVEYFSSFTEDYLFNDINTRAFWYFY